MNKEELKKDLERARDALTEALNVWCAAKEDVYSAQSAAVAATKLSDSFAAAYSEAIKDGSDLSNHHALSREVYDSANRAGLAESFYYNACATASNAEDKIATFGADLELARDMYLKSEKT